MYNTRECRVALPFFLFLQPKKTVVMSKRLFNTLLLLSGIFAVVNAAPVDTSVTRRVARCFLEAQSAVRTLSGEEPLECVYSVPVPVVGGGARSASIAPTAAL